MAWLCWCNKRGCSLVAVCALCVCNMWLVFVCTDYGGDFYDSLVPGTHDGAGVYEAEGGGEYAVHPSCTSGQETPAVLAFFAIPTRLIDRPRRDAIRETWLTVEPTLRSYKFFVGVSANMSRAQAEAAIAEENLLYEDVVLLDGFIDSYRNLTLKTLALILWAHEHEHFEFLVKIDDDVFPNVKDLVNTLLLPHRGDLNVYMGHMPGILTPIRDSNNKWYLSRDVYPNDTFPWYVIGGLYVLGHTFVRDFVRTMDPPTGVPAELVLEDIYTRFHLVPLEDVSVGIIVEHMHTTRVHVPQIAVVDDIRALLNHSVICDHGNGPKGTRRKHKFFAPSANASGTSTCRALGTRTESGSLIARGGLTVDVFPFVGSAHRAAFVLTAPATDPLLRAHGDTAALVLRPAGATVAAALLRAARREPFELLVLGCGGCELDVLEALLASTGSRLPTLFGRVLVQYVPLQCAWGAAKLERLVVRKCALTDALASAYAHHPFHYNWLYEAWQA
eukprot:TRINITY_DN5400_c0_g1_i2.p1 TRINITY_DN5400_c0_g1~~TRINITY_DN5400_c0_g1_i2.p1  ORF type:complete len:503 (-),score=102.13 TRINITY_DN5400_c0_g1_i2:733-2241(-)